MLPKQGGTLTFACQCFTGALPLGRIRFASASTDSNYFRVMLQLDLEAYSTLFPPHETQINGESRFQINYLCAGEQEKYLLLQGEARCRAQDG